MNGEAPPIPQPIKIPETPLPAAAPPLPVPDAVPAAAPLPTVKPDQPAPQPIPVMDTSGNVDPQAALSPETILKGGLLNRALTSTKMGEFTPHQYVLAKNKVAETLDAIPADQAPQKYQEILNTTVSNAVLTEVMKRIGNDEALLANSDVIKSLDSAMQRLLPTLGALDVFEGLASIAKSRPDSIPFVLYELNKIANYQFEGYLGKSEWKRSGTFVHNTLDTLNSVATQIPAEKQLDYANTAARIFDCLSDIGIPANFRRITAENLMKIFEANPRIAVRSEKLLEKLIRSESAVILVGLEDFARKEPGSVDFIFREAGKITQIMIEGSQGRNEWQNGRYPVN